MEYKLEFKPTERKPGMKYKTILLTDFTFHTAPKRPSTFLGKIKRAFGMIGSPGRIYQSIPKPNEENQNVSGLGILDSLKDDPEFIKYVTEEQKKGVEIVFQIPKAGLPVFAGKDTVEFISSKNGQRIIRGLMKNNLAT